MAELVPKLFVRSRWSAVKRPACVCACVCVCVCVCGGGGGGGGGGATNGDVTVDKVLPQH